jgi:hypothetical protein
LETQEEVKYLSNTSWTKDGICTKEDKLAISLRKWGKTKCAQYETHLKGIKLVAWALKLIQVLFENYYQFNSCIVKLTSMMQNMNSCTHKDTFFLTQETTGEGKVGRLTVHVTKNSTFNIDIGETYTVERWSKQSSTKYGAKCCMFVK